MQSVYKQKLATVQESRDIDSKTINEYGISGDMLMETAGFQAADIIVRISEKWQQPKILILCGKGNNAGDGLVIARYLSLKGYHISVAMLLGVDSLSEDCRKNYNRLKNIRNDSNTLCIIENPDEVALDKADIIIDALFGTGLQDAVREPAKSWIQKINRTKAFTISLDIPSGLDGDSGKVLGVAVKADYTIQFGTRKLGLHFGDGSGYSGNLEFCPLSFPSSEAESITREALDTFSHPHYLDFKKGEHKYKNGVVHIISGSAGMTGACVLAAKSAWYTGLGSVIVHTPAGLLSVYDKYLLQQVKKAYGSTESRHLTLSMAKDILENIQQKEGVLLIGPGLGREKETVEAIQIICENYDGNLVIDADALYAVDYQKIKGQVIITPHTGELKFLDAPNFESEYQRLLWVENAAVTHSMTILSKGTPTIAAFPNSRSFVTTYDSRVFTRSGFGDVLAGKLAGFWSISEDKYIAIQTALSDMAQRYTRFSQTDNTHLPDPADYV